MDVGTLDRRVTFLRATTSEGSYGNNETWETLTTRWASKEDVSDGEKTMAGTTLASRVSRFVVRFDSVTRTITASDRLRCEGVTYDILGVKDRGERRTWREFTCQARAD